MALKLALKRAAKNGERIILDRGKHIPVKDYANFIPHPDVSVLFAWNHKKEILQKESNFKGKWITHLYNDLLD